MPTVSVVVPVLNASRTLPACLEALGRLDPAPAEILLVDNGSSDGSDDQLAAFARSRQDVQLLRAARRGPGPARNAGIRAASGDIVAFVDADCIVERGWLRALLPPFQDPAIGGVAGRLGAPPPDGTLELFSSLFTLQTPATGSRHTRWSPGGGGFSTANLAVRHRLALELEGFTEAAQTGEDHDLCARLYAAGYAIQYVPEARVLHRHRTTFRAMLRQAFGFGQGHPFLIRRHLPRGLWLDLPGGGRLVERFPGRGWLDLASADKKLLLICAAGLVLPMALWLLPLYALWLARLTHRQAGRAGTQVSPGVALQLAGLLVAKSAAMTAGRWYGSVKYGALCL